HGESPCRRERRPRRWRCRAHAPYGRLAARSRRGSRPGAYGSSLLSRVEPVPLDEPDAVLARDRSAEPEGEFEERFGKTRRERELLLVVACEQERRVE